MGFKKNDIVRCIRKYDTSAFTPPYGTMGRVVQIDYGKILVDWLDADLPANDDGKCWWISKSDVSKVCLGIKHVQRAINEACYIIENKTTLRDCAKRLGTSKSTVHVDMMKLKFIDYDLYTSVRAIIKDNLELRYTRGGQSTRRKYRTFKEGQTVKFVGPRDKNNCEPKLNTEGKVVDYCDNWIRVKFVGYDDLLWVNAKKIKTLRRGFKNAY